MNNNEYSSFRKSAETFIHSFDTYREKRIVLYGIGQYTASLVSMAKGFHFVGVMDGDENNIGRVVYGLRVIGIDEAKKNADLIVINTSSFYWNLIYERIADIGIPVYYPNGERAIKKTQRRLLSNAERKISKSNIQTEIDCAEIISFDIFDTLLMRLVCNPFDVFRLVELQLTHFLNRKIPFQEMRNKAVGALQKENYTMDELYNKMQEMYPDENVILYKEYELKTENAIIVSRKDMIDIFHYAVMQKKEIYLLSDMYLPLEFLLKVLEQYGVKVDREHLWISGELGVSKRDRHMWEKYSTEVIQGKRALHIGDSIKTDVEPAQELGIQTLKIASATDMLRELIPIKIWSSIKSPYESILVGMIANELFNSPFAWEEVADKFCITTCKKFGSAIFGSVVLVFLLWLLKECQNRNIERLVFLSRDGYFLKQDYLTLINRLNIKKAPNAEYLFVSRKAILTLAAQEEEAFSSLLEFSYSGNFQDYLSDRFDIQVQKKDENAKCKVQLPKDKDQIRSWLNPYIEEINKKIRDHYQIYGSYIKAFEWSEGTAIVDIGYTGTIQYWLSKVLNKNLKGMYWVADISEKNLLKTQNEMIPCFQADNDCRAENSNIWKNHKVVESFLTAPYGMIKSVDMNGEFLTYETGNNQKYFMQRELINE